MISGGFHCSIRRFPTIQFLTLETKFQWVDFSDAGGFDEKFTALIEALDTNLERKQADTRLPTHAKEWESAGNDKSFLLRERT
jgi:hypothetical protein